MNPQLETPQQTLTPQNNPKTEAFLNKVLGDTAAFLTIATSAIGDRLGFFKDMAGCGPQTAAEIAACTKTDLRYAQEWLNQMTAAGYIRHDAATDRFELPPENVAVLAQERGPFFLAGIHSYFLEKIKVFDQVVEAFQKGGGVPQSAYTDRFYNDMDRFTAIWHRNLLLQQFLPAAPGLVDRLQRGVRVADVGCGQGRALVKLAQAFPKSQFVGYDVHAPNIEKAKSNAREGGVENRIRFEARDVSKGLPETFDIITTFDVIHDAARPTEVLTSIRKALRPGGTYLNLDINCQPTVEGNVGPLSAMLYGASIFYCLTTSLSGGGAGLGTMGLHEPKLQELGKAAGFRTIRRLAIENPFNNLYTLEA